MKKREISRRPPLEKKRREKKSTSLFLNGREVGKESRGE